MFFGIYVKKTEITPAIRKDVAKSNKKLRKELNKIHTEVMLEMTRNSMASEKKFKDIIKGHEKQHKKDLRARDVMNNNRSFFRKFREKFAPEIIDAIERLSKTMREIDQGEFRDNDAERKDSKVVQLQQARDR